MNSSSSRSSGVAVVSLMISMYAMTSLDSIARKTIARLVLPTPRWLSGVRHSEGECEQNYWQTLDDIVHIDRTNS